MNRLIYGCALAIISVVAVGNSGAVAKPQGEQGGGKGAQILEKQGCLHCHYLRGDGGLIGPPFEGIRKYKSAEDIVNVLSKKRPLPRYYPKGILDPREYMRHVKLDKSTAQEVANYLLSIPDEEALELKGHDENDPDSIPKAFNFVPQKPSDASREGLALYKDMGCAACHSIAGTGGWRGPGLDGVGSRLSKNGIENRISNGVTAFFQGKEYKPAEYSMPPSNLSQEQVKQITEFLMTLPRKPDAAK